MMSEKDDEDPDQESVSPLEWAAASLGLILTIAILSVVGWQASFAPSGRLPEITVEAGERVSGSSIHVVAIVARNHSPATAANVVVEGTLLKEGAVVERTQTTFDYVPGNSSRRGGLIFARDPAAHDVQLRAMGYVDP